MMRASLQIGVVAALSCGACLAQEPLHRRIDRLVAAGFEGEPAPRSDDAEFFRRVHLDLAGRIPSVEHTRRFLQDTSAAKRSRVIDQLLDAPSYARQMADLFHVMLMERRGDDEEWQTFLRSCFEVNKPWNQMVREILKPVGDDESLRGAAYFYTRRLEKVGQNPTDYPGLTRDVGRLFLGVDLQCAQCHDHLFIDDYKQREFQGLLAVYENVSIRQEKFPAVNEAAMTSKLEFASVFDSTRQSTGPRVPFGKEFEVPEPPANEASPNKSKPDANEPPFSALALIAEELPRGDSPLFRKNIANRLWFFMMGRGLVEPLDQHHTANPATHPELLQLLADELAAHDFDIKWMIRELALTETWQRSSRTTAGGDPPRPETHQLGSQRRLTPDQLLWSTLQATGNLRRLAPQDDSDPSEEFEDLRERFLGAFSGEPKEPAIGYKPSVKQALFLLNDSQVLSLLKPQSGNLTERLLATPDEQVADELFLSLFCRLPNDAERKLVQQQLDSGGDRQQALIRLAWAMLTSMEFCVNH